MAAGYRSYAGLWVGGIGAPVESVGGYESLLAFWVGGAAADSSAPPSLNPGGAIFSRKRTVDRRSRLIELQRRTHLEAIWREDEEIVSVIIEIIKCS